MTNEIDWSMAPRSAKYWTPPADGEPAAFLSPSKDVDLFIRAEIGVKFNGIGQSIPWLRGRKQAITGNEIARTALPGSDSGIAQCAKTNIEAAKRRFWAECKDRYIK